MIENEARKIKMNYYEDELRHHGVKGQKWGVRHGPPYPLDGTGDIHIRGGVKFHRLSRFDESESLGHAYVNYLNQDRDRYRGFFGVRLKAMNPGSDVYKVELEAKHDMKAPSKDKRVQEFVSMFADDPMVAKKMSKYYKHDWHHPQAKIIPEKVYEKRFNNMHVEKLKTTGYQEFVKNLGDEDSYIRDKYFERLGKQGYSFITDDMDAGRFGKEPTIVFDRKKSTKYKGQSKLSDKEIKENLKKHGTYMYGRRKTKKVRDTSHVKLDRDLVNKYYQEQDNRKSYPEKVYDSYIRRKKRKDKHRR